MGKALCIATAEVYVSHSHRLDGRLFQVDGISEVNAHVVEGRNGTG